MNPFSFLTYILCTGTVSKFINLNVYKCPLSKNGYSKGLWERKILVFKVKDSLTKDGRLCVVGVCVPEHRHLCSKWFLRLTGTHKLLGQQEVQVLVLYRSYKVTKGDKYLETLRLLRNDVSSYSETLWQAEFGCNPCIGDQGVGTNLI